MNASELNETERLALMALLKLMISADGQLSEPESEVLKAIADQVGFAAFQASFKQAQETLKTLDDMKAAIAAVERPEARYLLYRLAHHVGESDQLIGKEISRLFWVAEQWGLDIDAATGQLRAD